MIWAMTDPPVSAADRTVALLGAADTPLLAQPFFANGDPGPVSPCRRTCPRWRRWPPFIGTVLGPSAIDARTKEIVILRTSARASYRYRVESHTLVALA